MLIAVIADTHLPRGRRRLPSKCVEILTNAGLILHAGDIAAVPALEEIEALGPPVEAIRGNVDSSELSRRLPNERIVRVDGMSLAMIHDAGPAANRLERLRARFPDADAVIFGHSHIPLHEEADGFQIFNPGSPTERRRAPRRSMGVASVRRGSITFEHVWLD